MEGPKAAPGVAWTLSAPSAGHWVNSLDEA